MKFKHIVFLILPVLVSFTSLHKYYMTTMQVDYQPKKNSIQCILNIFTDDMEDAINNTYQSDFTLTKSEEPAEIDSLFNTYLSDKIQFTINQKKTAFNYIGHQYTSDAVKFYFEFPIHQPLYELEIENRLLTEVFPDQENMIRLKAYGKFYRELLNSETPKKNIKFK